ncbi:MAG: UDP-2,3-diacylglucosamine diphosphatase LpxI [Planctomycetota bacterium]
MSARSAPMLILPDPPAPPAPLGLIAAGGRLPLLVAQGMHDAGHAVCGLGLRGQYADELPGLCDQFSEAATLRLNSWGSSLRAMGVSYAVMVGKIDKAPLMHSWAAIIRNRPDLRTLKAWFLNRTDRRSHVMLSLIADELAKDGVHLIDSTSHIPEHLSSAGVMTSRKPTGRQLSDIEFGWPLLQELLRLDIGQAISVREGDVIAVEAVEGTDQMI